MSNIVQQFSDASPVPVGHRAVVLFTAEWHEACMPGGAMDRLLTALAVSTSDTVGSSSSAVAIDFGRCNAEENLGLTESYGVTAVPTFVLVNEAGVVVERVVGGDDAAAVTLALQRLANTSVSRNSSTNATATASASSCIPDEPPLKQRLDRLIRSSDVMLFMKGTPTQPKCGFSRQVVELLQAENIQFASFDILTDETVRQGLKTHSNWPTFPQIYLSGELIGGLDILKEMKEEGSLAEQFNIAPTAISNTATTLEDRLKALVKRSPVMLFMKGLPSAPKCGFSRQTVQLLEGAGISYDAFDILTDEEVRQGLKAYSDWPTYPQVYVNGDLIGGLDILKEMGEDSSLKEALLGGES